MYQKQVSFGDAVRMALTVNYCNFAGRSSRSEYWWFALFSFAVSCLISLIFGPKLTGEILSSIAGLFFLLPSLGLCVRRLHDTNRSGWWILINLIPLIGNIWFLILMCQDSEMNPNKYGPVPNVAAN